ncbi:MAG: hypothetical protein QM768_19270 [Agriterribacter sp.]
MTTTSYPTPDRIENTTPSSINSEIETNMWNRVAALADSGSDAINTRIKELEQEWDIEQYLGVNMSTLALSGIAAGIITKNRAWLILPAIVLAFFMQHSVHGWCPPLPLLRKLGVRTTREIEREKYALKFVRGDFKNMENITREDVKALKQAINLS